MFVYDITKKETFDSIVILENKILHFEKGTERCLDTEDLITYTFELIEDEIDIDNIEEYKQKYTERCIDIDIRNKMNEILQAVKQLNERVKRLEEK